MTLTWTTIQPTSPLSQQSQPTNKNFESAWPQSELALAQPSNHSKMCLSTSWNASLADSSCDCAAKYFRSVWWRFFLTQSSISLLAMLYSKSRRRRLSRYDFMFLLLITWHLNGFIMLKSISLRSLAMALWGASALVMAFVASFILQQSAFIKGSSTAASPVVVLSAKTTKPSARLSTPVGDFDGIIPDSHWSTGRKQHLASFRWVFSHRQFYLRVQENKGGRHENVLFLQFVLKFHPTFHEDFHLLENILQSHIKWNEVLHDPFEDGVNWLTCEKPLLENFPLHSHRW